MSTAIAQDRLRQIAILVSCVDATAARQILLHLPTDTARRVRALAAELGPVTPEEKRKILAEFRRSAAPPAERPAASSSVVSQPVATSSGSEAAANAVPQPSERFAADAAPQPTLPSCWVELKPAALARFVRHERAAVTAVVLSQVDPAVAAEVLQQLPPETSREVLLRLSRLEEIDPEAMQAIDEHLSQRLTEYQHHINSEMENSRRIEALLAAAPDQVRQQWSEILVADGERFATSTFTTPTPQVKDVLDIGDQVAAAASQLAGGEPRESARAAAERNPFTTADVDGFPRAVAESHYADGASQASDELDSQHADLLPFPNRPGNQYADAADRSWIQIQFEEILDLPPATLAQLLSATESRFVLLALAGATPRFTKRFMNMLDRRDAKILQNRLQRIGPIRLRDVDEAQRRIIENAAQLERQPAMRGFSEMDRRAVA